MCITVVVLCLKETLSCICVILIVVVLCLKEIVVYVYYLL